MTARMTKRQISCPSCGQDMFLAYLTQERQAPNALVYECPSCHKTVRVALDEPSNKPKEKDSS